MARNTLPYLFATVAVIIWGATPAATDIAVAAIDAVTVGMLRTIIAALVLFPLALILKFPKPKDRKCWFDVAFSALAVFVGFTLLFTVGQKFTSTAHAALILAAAPVFTGFFGFVVGRKWPRLIWWIGAIIALVGEGFLIAYRTPGSAKEVTVIGDLLVLVSVMSVSAGYVTGGRSSSKIGAMASTAWSISLAALVLAPVLVWRLGVIQLAPFFSNLTSWGFVIFLALFTSIVGYGAWCWAIGQAGIAHIAPIQFGQPIVSIAIAVTVLGERITAPILIAVFTILVGLALTRKSNNP